MYCGIDLANKTSAICIVDNGEVIKEFDCATDDDGFLQALRGFEGLFILLEASPLSEWVAQILEGLGHTVKLIDPRRAAALIRTKKKTDRLDARHLARMAHTQWYHEVHRKSAPARLLRTHLQARQGVINGRKSQLLRIRGLLRAHGIKVGGISAGKFEMRVRELVQSRCPALSVVLEPLLDALRSLRRAEAALTKALKAQVKSNAQCQLLMTAPGVGVVTAACYVATVDDPHRFDRSDQVAAYFGLVPRVYQTGEKEYRGRITKEGDNLMRTLMVEAGHVLLTRTKSDHALKQWGQGLREKKGPGKARVAVARKLSMVLHQMWLNNEPFQMAL